MASGTVTSDNVGGFKFNLDGLASAAQMDKLIALMQIRAGALKGLAKAEQDHLKALAGLSEASKSVTGANKDETKAKVEGAKRQRELDRATANLTESFAEGRFTSGFKRYAESILGENSGLALGLTAFGTTLGFLKEYATKAGEALKIGVAGNVLDLAVAAKSAGLNIDQFTKGLIETGGGFASLGSTSIDGAKQFGLLVNQVRADTAAFGNLGLSVDELTAFTGQQVKIAVAQGFKGRAAQEQVRKNTVSLGKDLQDLSEKTGKSITELAMAANKLASDPLISALVSGSKSIKTEVSAAVASFAANLRGVFGERGELLATDALKSAAAGLPLAMTEAGRSLLIAGQPLYAELTRLAESARNGNKVTEEDTQRLAELAKKEVEQRGAQIRTMAMLDGPAGESARQLLELAQQAEFYNSEQGKQARNARKFVAEQNRLSASMQQVMLPVVEALNLIDWAAFSSVVAGAIDAIKVLTMPITLLADGIGYVLSLFGAETKGGFIGTIIGTGLAMGGLLAAVIAASKAVAVFSAAMTKVSMSTSMPQFGKFGSPKSMGGIGNFAKAAVPMAIAGTALAQGVAGSPTNTGGSVGGVVGSLAGPALASTIGRFAGGALGTVLGGPAGTAIGVAVGGVAGQFIGDTIGKIFSDSNEEQRRREDQNRNSNAELVRRIDETNTTLRYQTQVASESLNVQRDTGRSVRDNANR